MFIAWRFDKEAYTGDVRKMFNQVKIHSDDQMFHRFLWRTSDTEQPRVNQWLRLNLGDKPAPDIAAATINTLAKASEAQYPEAAKELRTHVYVDIRGSIEFRIDLQELWSVGYSWDEILPKESQTKWMENVQVLNQLSKLEFSRKLKPDNAVGLPEIHGWKTQMETCRWQLFLHTAYG